MDWNSYIGQHEAPPEPFMPPPVLDLDAEQQSAKRAQSLLALADKYLKDSKDFKLPELKTFTDYEKAGIKPDPELIKGILRRSQKMMLSGASKSGKSFMLIELALSLASGRKWLGFDCVESKVIYLNLEIAENSFGNRIKDVSEAMKLKVDDFNSNLKIINLRGTSSTLEKMAGALIAAMLKEEAETGIPVGALILDPIYKISNGEENSAKDVGEFCNQLDKIATATGCSVIYSHHHSKGDQGFKSAQDRASGSGVFARDADAMIDMIELEIDKDTYLAMKNVHACNHWTKLLDEKCAGWRDEATEGDLELSGNLSALYQKYEKLTQKVIMYINENIEADFQQSMKGKVPLRLEFTLREFRSPDPINVFFDHPVHVLDESGVLSAADPLSHIQGQKKEKVKAVTKNKIAAFYEATSNIIASKGFATYQDITEVLGYKDDTIRKRLEELTDEFDVVKGGGKEKTKIYFKGEAPVD